MDGMSAGGHLLDQGTTSGARSAPVRKGNLAGKVSASVASWMSHEENADNADHRSGVPQGTPASDRNWRGGTLFLLFVAILVLAVIGYLASLK
jgi:hypothetical protein